MLENARSLTTKEWMWHSYLLCTDMVRVIDTYIEMGIKTPDDKARLLREQAARRDVWEALNCGETVSGEALIWLEYITGHAEAQVKRAQNIIDDKTFYAECRALRQEREARLSESTARAA